MWGGRSHNTPHQVGSARVPLWSGVPASQRYSASRRRAGESSVAHALAAKERTRRKIRKQATPKDDTSWCRERRRLQLPSSQALRLSDSQTQIDAAYKTARGLCRPRTGDSLYQLGEMATPSLHSSLHPLSLLDDECENRWTTYSRVFSWQV